MNSEKMKSLVEQIHGKIQSLPLIEVATFEDPHNNDERQVQSMIHESLQSVLPSERERIQSEFFDVGPLGPLLSDTQITEIIINGANAIWYEREGQLHLYDDHFLSPLTYRNFVQRLSKESERQVTLETPFVDGNWRGFRLHLIGPPISHQDVSICLRRHPKNPWTLEKLKSCNWCSEEQFQHIKNLIFDRKNFIVVGTTGSGKTSVLNACLQSLPPQERAIILEESVELSCPNSSSIQLLTREDPARLLKPIDQALLLRQSLRMRPDRIVMGEIRGPEAKDLLMALSTGHSGSWGTLHASSAHQALIRLEMLTQLGAPTWNTHAIRSLIQMSLNAILVVCRDRSGKRKLEGLYSISSLEEFGFLLEQVC